MQVFTLGMPATGPSSTLSWQFGAGQAFFDVRVVRERDRLHRRRPDAEEIARRLPTGPVRAVVNTADDT